MRTSDHHNATTGTTVDGMLLFSNYWAHVLFDTGASHSFTSILFMSMLGLEYETLESTLSVGVPLGRDYELSFQCSVIQIDVGG